MTENIQEEKNKGFNRDISGLDDELKSVKEKASHNELQVGLMAKDISQVNKGIKELNDKFDKLTDKLETSYVTRNEVDLLKEEIKELQNSKTWSLRAIAGAILSLISSVVLFVLARITT